MDGEKNNISTPNDENRVKKICNAVIVIACLDCIDHIISIYTFSTR